MVRKSNEIAMNKENITSRILLINLCLLLIFTGCRSDIVSQEMTENPSATPATPKTPETVSVPNEDEDIEDVQKEEQDYSGLSLDEKIYMYLREYGSMPVFSEVEEINEEWLVSKFYRYKFSIYEDYYLDRFFQFYSTFEDIEKMSQKYINPQIQIDHATDGSKYDTGLVWNPELSGFMFSATGGRIREYDYLSLDINDQNGLFHVSCVEVMIVWDDEYMHENGIVYIGSKEVGAVKGYYSWEKKDYSFEASLDPMNH